MTQTIEELSEDRQKWVELSRKIKFEEGLKRLLSDLYPDNAHFIYELLQNAEDAHAQEVRFILYEDRIEFEHDGKRLFSIQDVDAITSIGFSTKRDDATNIGKFGVGFKAVFAYTETPEIESGEFHFQINDMVVPKQDGLSKKQSGNKQTLFVLPFNNPKKPIDRARNEIETLLRKLDAATLLFLTHIRKIEYLLPNSSLGYIERKELGGSRFEIRVQQPDELIPLSTWFLKFDKEVQVEDEEAENEEHKVKTCRIALAFGMSPVEAKAEPKNKIDDDAKTKPEWVMAPMEPGNVCIYFPADKETSNLRFHLHAPFASTVARDSVRDCSANEMLRDHLADLLAESMHTVRDQGLLTVRTLALMPNDKDNLPEFYKPLMTRLVEEFKKMDLVPMKSGGHAAAYGIFRGRRALSDLIDDDDLVTLLGNGYSAPMWVANPPQRNQREDNFLSMLDIEEWTTIHLVKALSEMDSGVRIEWMGNKDVKWHQHLYGLLLDYMDSDYRYQLHSSKERVDIVKRIELVCCNDGKYRKGSDCYFPIEEIEDDEKFPLVDRKVYIEGNEENKKARRFLETIGVRKVDERVKIESLLRSRYSKETVERNTFKPDLKDTQRFIDFVHKNPDDSYIFHGFFIFKLENGKWETAQSLYLDLPYMDTGLSAWYDWLGEEAKRHPLSSDYGKLKIKPDNIGEFAEKLGALTKLKIERIKVTTLHPQWNYFDRNGGDRDTGSGVNENYRIIRLINFLESPSIDKSRLIWKTMKESCSEYWCRYLRARFGRNASNIAEAKSTLVHDLRAARWIPQKNHQKIEFVQPPEAVAEKLPGGFEYQTWHWLEQLEFGEGPRQRRKIRERELEKLTAEYKAKEEVLIGMGFESTEEAEKMALIAQSARKKNISLDTLVAQYGQTPNRIPPSFPSRPVPNPDRRQERLNEQVNDASNKEYKKRNRSVRVTNTSIDPITWIRNQYTNDDGQMVCQICKEEHFRKRNGEHYFEKKEVLSRKFLPKENEAQYLALCPLCAAKYEEFVKNDENAMTELKETIISTDDCEIPISLCDQETSIRFVETHYHDLKIIIMDLE